MSEFPKWLTKQMVSGIRGFNLDAYLMALEGWRRGLTLTWYSDPSTVTDLEIIGFNPLGKTFSLTTEDKTHFFYRSRGDKVANESVQIGADKHQTKSLLKHENVAVPEGKNYEKHMSVAEIAEDAITLEFPLVVKPTLGSLGKGVTTNIQNKSDLKQAIQHVRDIEYEEVVIERFVQGDDYRIYVVDNQVVGAIKRVPANVVGDGNHTIEQLIRLKNENRKENPYLKTRLIEADSELISYIKQQNYTLQSVPETDETVYLRGAANISGGGDPIEAMNDLNEDVKQTAINAIKAIPGLKHAGVDMLISKAESVVLEVNTTADISMHIFPLVGQPSNVPEAIMDYYFPETKGMAIGNEKLYFGYKEINELLKKNLVQEFQVTNATQSPLFAKRYVVSGKVQKVAFRNWIRKEANKRGLSGYARNLNNGKVVVVVGGEKDKVINFKKQCQKGSVRAKVEKVEDHLWESQIKVGFEIRKSKSS